MQSPARRSLLPAVPDLIMLSYTIAGQAMAPFIPLYAQDLGMNTGTIGLLLGVPGLAAVLVSVFAAAWLARLGARRLLVSASLVGAVALLVVWVRGSALAFVLVMPLFWAVQPVIAIASQLLVVTRSAPQGRDQAVGMHAFYTALGNPIGPLLGSAAIHALGGIGSVFLVGAAATGIACLVALTAPDHGRADVARVPFLAGLRSLSILVRASLATIMIAEFCYVAWGTFFPLALEQAGRAPEAIGLIFAIYGVAISGVRPLLGRLVSRLRRPGVLALSLILVAAGLWVSTVPGSAPLVYASAVLLGFGFGLVFPITILLVTAEAAADQVGQLLAARFFAMTIGQMLGPVLIGAVAGYSLIGALAGVAVLGTATAVWALSLARFLTSPFLDTRKSAMLR